MPNRILISMLVLTMLFTACGQGGSQASGPAGPAGQISVAGSTTVQPLAEKLAESYSAANPQIQIDVQGGGTSVGVKSAGEGAVDVGTASRELAAEEKAQYPDLQVYEIALDGIAVVVNPDVPVADLTKEQVRDIFSGKTTNWKELGGPDKPILVVSREEGSGTRGAFEELVMDKESPIVATAILQPSNGAIRTTVSTTPDSIGYLSFGYLDNTVRALKIGGVEATEANVVDKTYPISRPLLMLTRGEPTGAVKAWLDWILSPDGQKIVGQEGYVPVR